MSIYDTDRQSVDGWCWRKFAQDRFWFQWIEAGASFDVAQEIGGGLGLARRQGEFWLNFVTRPKWRVGITGEENLEGYGNLEFMNRNIGFQIESNVGGMTGVSSSYSVGSLYGKHMRFLHLGFLILPHRTISVFPIFQAIRVGETRWQWLTNIRISYQITDRAFLRAFVQAESEGVDTPRDDWYDLEKAQCLNSNLLFGYEFAPGTIGYLVYNQPRDFNAETIDHIFVAKFTYSLRF